MEISSEGPPAVKLTREELQARVELLTKKRSLKRKAENPLESDLPAWGKTPKLGAFVLPSPVKER